MSMNELDEAIALIKERGGDFEGEKDEALIVKAEAALGVSFPPTYDKFVRTLGCGDIEGLEFYGLIHDDFENSSVPDAVWLTLSERKAGMPRNLIVVYATGDGTYFAIDTSEISPIGECPVVSYRPDGSVTKVAEDYGSFLLAELQTVL